MGARWLGPARLILGLAISGASLAVLLRDVDWPRFWSSVTMVHYGWLALSFALLPPSVLAKVLRWQMLLRPAGDVSLTAVYHGTMVGYLANIVLPGRLGELARALVLSRLERLKLATVLCTVAVDRVLDVVVLALLLSVALPSADLPEWVAQSGLALGAGGFVLLLFCLVLAYPAAQSRFQAMLRALPSLPGKAAAEHWTAALCVGLGALRNRRPRAGIAATSLGIWALTALQFYFGEQAFGIHAPLASAALLPALTSLGMVVPSSPGYVGVYHYLVVVALGAYGVNREVALGFAVVIHLAQSLPFVVLGAVSLWRCGLSLGGQMRELAAAGRQS